jgi:hypothetical protein
MEHAPTLLFVASLGSEHFPEVVVHFLSVSDEQYYDMFFCAVYFKDDAIVAYS